MRRLTPAVVCAGNTFHNLLPISHSIKMLCHNTTNTCIYSQPFLLSSHTFGFLSLSSCSTTNTTKGVRRGASPAVFLRCFESIIFLPCATSYWVQADAKWHPCGPKLLSAILLAALLCQHAPSCFHKVITLTKKNLVTPVKKKKSVENENSEL